MKISSLFIKWIPLLYHSYLASILHSVLSSLGIRIGFIPSTSSPSLSNSKLSISYILWKMISDKLNQFQDYLLGWKNEFLHSEILFEIIVNHSFMWYKLVKEKTATLSYFIILWSLWVLSKMHFSQTTLLQEYQCIPLFLLWFSHFGSFPFY